MDSRRAFLLYVFELFEWGRRKGLCGCGAAVCGFIGVLDLCLGCNAGGWDLRIDWINRKSYVI